jgi:hypothetical protein
MLVLGIGWVWAAAAREEFWTGAEGVLIVLVASLVVASLKLALARTGCEVAESAVVIHRAFGSSAILYPSITRTAWLARCCVVGALFASASSATAWNAKRGVHPHRGFVSPRRGRDR